jgi:hypothetical protein
VNHACGDPTVVRLKIHIAACGDGMIDSGHQPSGQRPLDLLYEGAQISHYIWGFFKQIG